MGSPWLSGFDALLLTGMFILINIPAAKHEFIVSNLCWMPSRLPGRYINVRHCGGLALVLLQLKDPLEVFMKRSEFLPRSGVSISSRYVLSC